MKMAHLKTDSASFGEGPMAPCKLPEVKPEYLEKKSYFPCIIRRKKRDSLIK